MRCDNCGNADAVIQLTKVKDNEMRVLHLCEACAADEGVEAATEPASPTTVHLADFLAQIGKSIGEEAVAAGRCPAGSGAQPAIRTSSSTCARSSGACTAGRSTWGRW